MMRTAAGAAALCALLAAGVAARGAALTDPTRPPGAGASAAGGQAGSRLQSVLISPGRRVAVIDGKNVVVGDKVGDATVVRISESEVVLRRAQGRETLKLFPAVDKTMPRRRRRAPATRSGGGEH